ncbi:MAG: ester cyclase [Sphingobacteriales bacterium]|nr:ester cyclase [Sphingobacteriales bacterium]MBI3719598.1 ester cyclase [Sphingobacteriales bacterium]
MIPETIYLDKAKQYLDAWNRLDADAIINTFAAGGIYSDPASGEISGEAIAANAKRLWTAFPDLSFDIVSLAEAGKGKVAAEWIMKGTNKGSFNGLPPTNRIISLPGADVMEIGTDGIRRVNGYFDTKTLAEQLGLQVLIQPHKLGPFSFGFSASVQSGNKTKPGAFGITTIWNADADTAEIRELTRKTATEMLGMEGFIGLTTMRIGDRGITISAWEKPEQIMQLRKGGTHAEAMKRFWAELSHSAFTSVWVPHHINPMLIRCTTCGKMNAHDIKSGVCSCGETLPEAPAYY